jgi:thiol-disulfide isomerase/thioredoxin
MNKNITQFIMFSAVLVAVFAGFRAQQWMSEESHVLEETSSAHPPNLSFVLPDLNGETRSLDEWRGNVVVLNFWATWCPPCRKEMPAFIDLQEQYGAQGLQFVGIALDEVERTAEFADALGVNYPILIGDTRTIELGAAYGNRYGALPFTVIIARDGSIHDTIAGEIQKNEIDQIVKSLL